MPARQLNGEALDLAAEEPRLALDGLGQAEAATRSFDSRTIPHFGPDHNDVAHMVLLRLSVDCRDGQ